MAVKKAKSSEEALETLKGDLYYKHNIWDWPKVSETLPASATMHRSDGFAAQLQIYPVSRSPTGQVGMTDLTKHQFKSAVRQLLKCWIGQE